MNLLSAYDSFKASHPAQSGMAVSRQEGFDFVSQKGLPTRHDEQWHYTSVKPLSDISFVPHLKAEVSLEANQMATLKSKLNPEFINLVFVNGIFQKNFSQNLPEGVKFRESSELKYAYQDSFDALNGAFLTTPWEMTVSPETSVDKPVNFLFFSSNSGGASSMSHPRVKIALGTRSSLRLLESFYGVDDEIYLSNSVVDIDVKAHAKLVYVRVQDESLKAFNIGRTKVNVDAFATVQTVAFATGARLSRHTLDVVLSEKGSHSQILGVYAVEGEQHVDNTSLIDHAVGECDTEQLYKGILDGHSRAVFCGKVLIRKDAQKANSAQLNNNLLLSKFAEADSKPSLEIYADDVKAAHGSTVGQLNKDEIFYLQSRAISKEKAIPMLSYGYLSEVIYKVEDQSIQNWLKIHLDKAFKRLAVIG